MSKKNKEQRKTMSCGAVVWRLNNDVLELLLIKQFAHKDVWGIPKGHIDEGETIEQCACREVREETGVKIVLGERLPDYQTNFKNENKTVASFLAIPIGDQKPTHDDPDSEVADARWIPISSLPPIHAYQQQLIETAIGRLTIRAASNSKRVIQDV